jgi:DMSO/TMAO reductase YedYZ molybdopterin-dependent catalytic subunit
MALQPPEATRMLRRHICTLAVACWCAAAAVAPQAWAQTDPAHTPLLHVGGAVQTPLALTREQLEALPWRAYAETREVQQDGQTVKLSVSYQGLPLRDLLDRAVLSPDRRTVRRAVVLLTARDGYRVSFSWGELYNSALGDSVILVRAQDGRDLIATDGLPVLRSLQDTRSGPRHVRWLERIDVLVLGD